MSLAAWVGLSSSISSPLDYSGCVYWYDASDAAQVTTSSGAVTAWANKGTRGSSTLAQATSGQRPTYQSAVQNGKNIIRFDGLNDVLTVFSSGGLTAVSGWTTFCVHRPASFPGATQNVFVVRFTIGSRAAGALVQATTGNSIFTARRHSADTEENNIGTALSTSLFKIQSAIAIMGTSLTTFINGAQVGQKTPLLTSGVTDQADEVYAGAVDTSGTTPFGGDLAEIVVYNTALTTVQHAAVVAYLKAKWAL